MPGSWDILDALELWSWGESARHNVGRGVCARWDRMPSWLDFSLALIPSVWQPSGKLLQNILSLRKILFWLLPWVLLQFCFIYVFLSFISNDPTDDSFYQFNLLFFELSSVQPFVLHSCWRKTRRSVWAAWPQKAARLPSSATPSSTTSTGRSWTAENWSRHLSPGL